MNNRKYPEIFYKRVVVVWAQVISETDNKLVLEVRTLHDYYYWTTHNRRYNDTQAIVCTQPVSGYATYCWLLTCQRHRSCQWQKLSAVRWAFYRLTIHDIQAVQTYYEPSLIVALVKQSATEGNITTEFAILLLLYTWNFINLWIFVVVFSVNLLCSTARVVYLFYINKVGRPIL